MKSARIFEAMGNIRNEYIEDALRFHKIRLWKRLLPIAACLVLVAGTVFVFTQTRPTPTQAPNPTTTTEPSGELPLLEISPESSGMGCGGLMAYSADEIVNNNPWRADMELTTLPVYQNIGAPVQKHSANPNLEAMQAWGIEVAKRLGFSESELTVGDNRYTPDEIDMLREKYAAIGESVPEGTFVPTLAVISAEGITIEVNELMEATIEFEPALSLPEQYNFNYYTSYEDTYAAGEYLLEQYSALLGMTQPVLCVYGGDYTYDGEQGYSIGVYEGAGSDEEQLINYNCRMASFGCDDDGKLFVARVWRDEPAYTKLGDYPIISSDEATSLLRQGQFLTTISVDFPGMEYVRRVELTYRGGLGQTLMPYYSFYVEIPELAESGLNTYGIYHVPAVEETYIENMPRWDGSFNQG